MERQPFALVDCVRNAAFELMTAREQCGACWCTRGANMKVGESNALAPECVQRRRVNDRIAEASEIAIADVVCHHENDVWPSVIVGLNKLCKNTNEANNGERDDDRMTHAPQNADRSCHWRHMSVLFLVAVQAEWAYIEVHGVKRGGL